MKEYKIASIAGDGIGKEVLPEGRKILKEVAKQHQFKLTIDEFDFASCDYYEKHGKMLPDDWQEKIGKHDAIFFGAVGDPERLPDHISLWGSLLKFRRDFDQYIKNGGYSSLLKIVNGKIPFSNILNEIKVSGLRGLGGAGFPTFKKWEIVGSETGIKYVAVNGDEGEPGTFKDRFYLEKDPHRILEGMLIAAYFIGAKDCYFYIRDEYPEIRIFINREIKKVKLFLKLDINIHIRRGAGAYICGEESAMIESIEGKRGLPRHRPPYVAQKGIFNKPTLVNNIETLYWIREIIEKGGKKFSSKGTKNHPGARSYSVSGRVKNPGVVFAPAGSTVNELILKCGGMLDGHKFKAYLPGGASGGILPSTKGDIPLDFGGELANYGCFVGSHAIVILSDKDNLADVALNLMAFFKHESCGQCTPCRNGTEKIINIIKNESKWDKE